MKISMKRVAALALTLVMIFGLLPVVNNTVNAVDVTGLSDGTVGLSYTFENSPNRNVSGWTADGNTINAVLQGVAQGSGKIYTGAKSTLTITNNKSKAATLSFDYAVTTSAMPGCTLTIDGETVTSGSFTKKLESGESISIVLNAVRGTNARDNKMTLAITNLILASASNDPITTTFEAPANGSYTVSYGSESLTVAAGTASQSATNLPSMVYTMTAVPGEGYKMVGWYNVTKDTYLGTALSYTGSFEDACTVKAVIVPENTAVFKAGNNYFGDLNDAVAYARRESIALIVLVQGGILPAGDYTVPAGITLLIPMDTDYTPTRTDDPDFVVAPEYTTEIATPYAYMTLTMADGASLTVNGTLDVESKHTALQGGKTTGGRPCGPYGAIYMSPEASIVLNDGSNLYAWGYVYGEGSVTANSGANVYEIMQVTDFPGGSNMTLFVDTDPTYDFDGDGNPANDYIKTFPFSQYYVQNIEVALTLKQGAAEYVYITMAAAGKAMGLPVRFIGEGGMFVPGEGGTIVKDYDPSTDRLNVTVNGDATMAGIALDLTGTQYEEAVSTMLNGVSKVDSASFILTLNGNITIDIASGTTTVKQDLALLPGVEISVAEDATLVVAERSYTADESDNLTVSGSYTGYNIYVWDMENWGKYVFSHKYFTAVSYSPTTGRYTRTQDDLKDVVIDINGTVLSEGYIYSTVSVDEETWLPISGGAQIISTGKTGKVVLQNGAGFEELAYCLDGGSNADGLMFVDSLWLQNGDGTFVLTDGAEAGTTYSYCDVHDLWYTEGHGNCVVINTVEITWIVNGVGAAEEYLLGETPVYKGATPTKPANGCTVYTFAGWNTIANNEVLTTLPAVTGDAVYFAVFTESQAHEYNNIWSDYNGNNTHTNCYECGKCYDSYIVVENCTNGKDDKEHECDVCFGELSACEDSNNDHACDICGEKLSDCYDNDDHYCDYAGCGEKLSDCAPGETEEYILLEPGCQDGKKNIITICVVCGGEYSNEIVPIPALGHGHSEGWEYIQIDDDVHQVWCADCWDYTYNDGHDYVSHVCEECGWTERMNVYFYNGTELWTETSAPYGGTLGIAGMPIPAAPTGYHFVGWYTEGGVKVVAGMIVTSDIVAYARWEKLTYVVTWVVDGASTSEIYAYGDTPSYKGNTDKAADGCTTYTFIGWDKAFAPITGPMTYTAQYESGISHIGQVKYINNGDGTHSGAYECCGVPYVTNEAHKYVNGVCVCGKLEHVCADNLTFHAAVTPDCCNGGNSAYYSCACGKFYSDASASNEIAKNSWILAKDSGNHTGMVGYSNNGADHTAAYSCCGESWNENHTYVYGVCVCDALKVSKLTVVYGVSGEYKIELMVPYGTRLFDVVDFDAVRANIYVHSADRWGHYEQRGFYGCFDNSGDLGYLYYFGENYIMPDCDFYVEARYVYNGFIHDGIGWQYIKDEHLYKDVLIGVMMGDLYEGGSFEEFEGLYALDENGYRIENGLFRDYYIGEWINGVTYEPNAEDIAYYESKGMTFIDAEQTWYYFGADGKWAYNYTGRFGNSYIVNGHAAWHVGLVEIDGQYFYFIGDEANGGNVMVKDCDYYISRNTATNRSFVIGGLYTFGADGAMCMYEGITNVNGTLRYYEDAQLMLGNGLTQVGENVIYVNSYGNLIVDAEYYIGSNELGIKKGIYTFDGNGFIVIPEEEPGKEGLHFEDGKWFYYVDGAKAYCAGLIQIDGNWVYVKSDGSLATGIYYVTNTNGHSTIASGTKCTFDANGVLIDPVLGAQLLEEGGIRDEFNVRTDVTLKANGKLTIDVSNISMPGEEDVAFEVVIYGADGSYYDELVRGEGIAEFDLPAGEYSVRIYIAFFHGAEDDDPGYGRGSLDYKITFTGDGTPLNGIVDGYYYVDGHIAYAAGLIEIDGIYYYVRSNGQIVTDCQYWITNVNDTGYEPGLYEFDTDGWMYEIYVETFTGIKDGYYYIDDEVAYAAGLVQYNGGYIYVRSNGQIATGKYWITNHNDLLPEGFYDFGENGVYYPAMPENAHLLMEVDKNVATDGFWDSNAIANMVRPSADGHLYVQVTDVTYEYETVGQGGFCIEFEGSYWVLQWDAVYKVGNGTVMIPVSAGEDVILFVNPADIGEDYVDSVYGTISYKVWSDVECELVQGSIGE